MVTIKDIAGKLGISYSTVSLALRNSPKIKKDTTELVKKTAREMGYRPNSVARSLVLQKTILVAMITPDISSPFYARIVEGAEAACREKGFNMLICNTNWDPKLEEQHLNLILERRIDGAVISPCNVHNPLLDKILAEDLPIGFVSSRYQHGKADRKLFVGSDNEQGGLLAVRHVLSKGQEGVAIIGGNINSESTSLRMKGYRKGFEEAGFPRSRVFFYEGDFSQAAGYGNSRQALEEHPEISCLICMSDLIAMGALKAAREAGRKVPEDLGVMGFDDTYLASLDAIRLTTVYQPKYEMGYRVMSRLLSKLGGEGGADDPLYERMPCRLSVRESV